MNYHRIVMRPPGILNIVWAHIRGILPDRHWREPCARCGFTGQVHWALDSVLDCRRFTVAKETFICARCNKEVPWSFGAADKHPNLCDDCWVAVEGR